MLLALGAVVAFGNAALWLDVAREELDTTYLVNPDEGRVLVGWIACTAPFVAGAILAWRHRKGARGAMSVAGIAAALVSVACIALGFVLTW